MGEEKPRLAQVLVLLRTRAGIGHPDYALGLTVRAPMALPSHCLRLQILAAPGRSLAHSTVSDPEQTNRLGPPTV